MDKCVGNVSCVLLGFLFLPHVVLGFGHLQRNVGFFLNAALVALLLSRLLLCSFASCLISVKRPKLILDVRPVRQVNVNP